MSYLLPFGLTCLLGLASLQATDNDLSALESYCRLKLIEEEPIAVAPNTFAFVYNSNAKETINRGGYRAQSPVIFNSTGSLKHIAYNSKNGQLTVPDKGYYKVTYSITPFSTNGPRSMALAVNGKEVKSSEIAVLKNKEAAPSTATFILSLAAGDHVSLILPNASGFFLDGTDAESSASLFITKL
jgi:hypothetical protein